MSDSPRHRPVPKSSASAPRHSMPLPSPTLPPDEPRKKRIRHPAPESKAAVRIRTRHTRKHLRRQAALTYIFIILLLIAIFGVVGSAVYRAVSKGENPIDSTTAESTSQQAGQIPPAGDSATIPPVTHPLPDAAVICIDPGHGYGDPGTGSDLLLPSYEKDINLAIACKLRDILVNEGYQVILTRDTDAAPDGKSSLTSEDRLAMLRELSHVDYFLSIHCGSYLGEKPISGAKIYYYTGNHDQTPAFAQSIAQAISTRLSTDLPPITAYASDAFPVIKHTLCPALWIEVGFATDAKDAANMKNDAWQGLMARAIANGLSEHIHTQES